jgi:hypothetical protein
MTGAIEVDRLKLPPKIITKEAAPLMRMCRKTLLDLAKKGKVPRPQRVGGRFLWDTASLLAFLSGQSGGAA